MKYWRRGGSKVIQILLSVPMHAWLVLITYGFSLIYIGYLSVAPPSNGEQMGGSYEDLFKAPYINAFITSIWIAFLTALPSVLLAMAAAWVIYAHFSSRSKMLALLMLFAPLLINHYVRISAIRLLISPNSALAVFVGSVFSGSAFDYSRELLILGLLSWTFPVSTLILYSGVSRIPLRSIQAAENLGATFINCQRYLVIPRTRLHATIAFISSFSFAITDNFSNQLMNQNRDYLLAGVISDLLKMQNWTMISILSTSVLLLEVGVLLLAIVAFRMRSE